MFLDPIKNRVSVKSVYVEAVYLEALLYSSISKCIVEILYRNKIPVSILMIKKKTKRHTLYKIRYHVKLYHPVQLLSNNKAYRAKSHYSLMSIIKSQEEIHQKLAEM